MTRRRAPTSSKRVVTPSPNATKRGEDERPLKGWLTSCLRIGGELSGTNVRPDKVFCPRIRGSLPKGGVPVAGRWRGPPADHLNSPLSSERTTVRPSCEPAERIADFAAACQGVSLRRPRGRSVSSLGPLRL